jgi:cell division protein FtsQ
MDRSFAGRLGLGAVTPRTTRSPARRRRAAEPAAATGIDRAIALLLALAAACARLLARSWQLLGAHRRIRAALIVALVATPALAGGWLWLRHSSLVAVRQVRVSGAHGADATAIDSALTAAARRMSTLDVDAAALRAAVAAYPIVGAVQVHPSFPHALRIRVIEQPPVAVASFDGTSTALAADGVVLGTAHASKSLPTLAATAQLSPGERVHSPMLLGALAVLGAAPAPLARDAVRAYESAKGLTVVLRGGLLAYFGDAARPHAKWLALARVLADAGSAGATYVDVRVPDRPAAGFPPGVAPPSVAGGEAEAEAEATGQAASASESSQSLAEGLSSAVGGSGQQASKLAGAGEEASSGEAQGASGEASAESTGASGESGAAGSGEAAAGEATH